MSNEKYYCSNKYVLRYHNCNGKSEKGEIARFIDIYTLLHIHALYYCPENTVFVSFGLDISISDRVYEQHFATKPKKITDFSRLIPNEFGAVWFKRIGHLYKASYLCNCAMQQNAFIYLYERANYKIAIADLGF